MANLATRTVTQKKRCGVGPFHSQKRRPMNRPAPGIQPIVALDRVREQREKRAGWLTRLLNAKKRKAA